MSGGGTLLANKQAYRQNQAAQKSRAKQRKTGLKLQMRRPSSSGSQYSQYSEDATERGSSDEEGSLHVDPTGKTRQCNKIHAALIPTRSLDFRRDF